MNANERNEIVKLIQPNILPNAVELEVKVTEDEKVIEETLPQVEVVEKLDEDLVNLELNNDEDEDNDITAIHDVSAGGLAIALSEMVISSDKGCEVELTSDELDENQLLYSESHGRYLSYSFSTLPGWGLFLVQ